MAIAFRSVAATSFGDPVSTDSPVVDAPAGVANGDLLLMMVQTEGAAISNDSIAGWTRIAEVVNSTDSISVVYYKVASSEGASWTMTDLFDDPEVGMCVVIAYTGVDGTSPINASAGANSNGVNAVSGPSVTPSVDNCMIVQLVGCDPGSTSYTGTADSSPTATERFDSKSAVNDRAYVYIQEYLQSTAAALALDVSFSATDTWGSIQVALKPAVSGINLTVADAYVTTQVDAITLTQVHNLTVADGAVTTQVDTVVLGAGINLTVQDAAVITQVDTVTLTLGPNILVVNPTDDVLINSSNSDWCGDPHNSFELVNNDGGQKQKGLIRWILDDIPAGSICTGATAVFTKNAADSGTSTPTISFYEISAANGDWTNGGGSITDPAGEGEPTWDGKEADGSGGVTTAWAGSAGLSTAGTDYVNSLVGSVTGGSGDPAGTKYTVELDTDVIAGWFGEATNPGLIFWPTDFGTAGHWAQVNDPTASYRPVLTVYYTLSDNLTVQDGAVTTQVDNVTLTQVHNLVVQDAAVTSQVDSITLTQVHNLTIQDASVTTQVDTVILTGAGDLVISDLSVTTQVDNITLTQVHNLTVQDAAVTTQTDSITLTQVYNLAVQDTAVTTQVDNVVLTQVHNLTVQDASVITQVDTIITGTSPASAIPLITLSLHSRSVRLNLDSRVVQRLMMAEQVR